ncbi:MAG TPA: peptidoglycan editing factor PgeF [Firmicutes bacterium]|nr:peptidoglycan editing factor PgeF [Bacillota bacterium]
MSFDSVGSSQLEGKAFRLEEKDKVKVLRVWPQEAGVSALFTLRPLSLSSAGPYGPATVEAHREMVTRAFLPRRPVTVHQVHGTRVLLGDAGAGAATGWTCLGQGDGLATTQEGLPLAVFCADCAPVYLYDRSGRRGALLHAGWRGALSGIPRAGVEYLLGLPSRAGAGKADLLAAVGPCIGPCCYRVGSEVEEAARQALGRRADEVLIGQGDGLHFDLAGAIAIMLEEAGVPGRHIQISRLCTSCHPEFFHSHRRDRGYTGRMAAILTLASDTGNTEGGRA